MLGYSLLNMVVIMLINEFMCLACMVTMPTATTFIDMLIHPAIAFFSSLIMPSFCFELQFLGENVEVEELF